MHVHVNLRQVARWLIVITATSPRVLVRLRGCNGATDHRTVREGERRSNVGERRVAERPGTQQLWERNLTTEQWLRVCWSVKHFIKLKRDRMFAEKQKMKSS